MHLSSALILDELKNEIYDNAKKHGFWESEDDFFQLIDDLNVKQQYSFKKLSNLRERVFQLHDIEKIALEHSELSERLERIRKDPDGTDEHCPEFKNVEIEAADLIIRVLDWCGRRNLRIGEALFAKHEYNKTRPYKHGKNF